MPYNFIVWHDNNVDLANWLIRNTSLKKQKDVKVEVLASTSSPENFPRMPREIQNLLYLDRHDLLITHGPEGVFRPCICIEFMTHTPQSQHTKQRFCRLVAAAEYKVPLAFIFPARKESGGQSYRCTPDIFYALQRLTDIHQVPALGFFWPDKNGILLSSKKNPSAPPENAASIMALLAYIELCLESAINGRPSSLLLQEPEIQKFTDENRMLAYQEPVSIDRYDSLELMDTGKFLKTLRTKYGISPKALPEYFRGRVKTLLQTHRFIAIKSQDNFRSDPYAGMQAFFDYCFCRVGDTPMQRRHNLAFRAEGVPFETYRDMYSGYWRKKCPFGHDKSDLIPFLNLHIKQGCTYTKNKQLRTYGYLSDILIFDDFVIFG